MTNSQLKQARSLIFIFTRNLHACQINVILPKIVQFFKIVFGCYGNHFTKKCKSVTEEFGFLQFIADSRDTFGNVQKTHTCIKHFDNF